MADEDAFMDGEDEEESTEPAAGGKNNLMKLLMLAGAGVVVIGLMFLIAFVVGSMMTGEEEELSAIEGEGANRYKTYTIREMRLNLNTPNTFAQIQISLAYDPKDVELEKELTSREHQITDLIQYIVASKTYEELNTAKEREEDLKYEIRWRVNSILQAEGDKIESVFFQKFTLTQTG